MLDQIRIFYFFFWPRWPVISAVLGGDAPRNVVQSAIFSDHQPACWPRPGESFSAACTRNFLFIPWQVILYAWRHQWCLFVFCHHAMLIKPGCCNPIRFSSIGNGGSGFNCWLW